MNQRNRAFRKHHERRLKVKRNRYNNAIGGHGLTYHTPCLCSCWMCGNQRHHNGAPISELKARAKFCE
ncbi:hypothetical protein CUN67_27060 (plasmid) [Pantoea cypripedii]|uniref:Uncharacterized protein n=1 Tax=Pantoea cypripedii TaxID=55209 RepID=A0A6B9GBA3_PANCY|nr:hypothetical protein CUN67_27060 [Pantoea cypripedii]